MPKFIIHSISPIVLLLLWEMCSRTGIFDVRFFPPPSQILHYLIFDSPELGLMNDIFASLYRIFWGYLGGSFLGLVFGMAMGLSPFFHHALYPVISVTYPIPKIAILPLIMLIFGIGELSKVMVVGIGSFFLVLINTLHGVKSMAHIYHDVASVYRIPMRQKLLKIVLPASAPSVFTGLRLAVGYSLVIVVAAEFSGADAGIGYMIWQSWETFSIDAMYAGIFVIGALGYLFAFSIDLLERKLLPWHTKL